MTRPLSTQAAAALPRRGYGGRAKSKTEARMTPAVLRRSARVFAGLGGGS
jgi:hypothetical protein